MSKKVYLSPKDMPKGTSITEMAALELRLNRPTGDLVFSQPTPGKQLPPGRELDAAIAEKVFNCSAVKTHEYGHRDVYPEGWLICRCPGSIHSKEEPKSGLGAKVQLVPFYSTDIAMAMQVVEKLETTFETSRDSYFKVDRSRSGYNVSLWFKKDVIALGWIAVHGKARALTLSHAICLAALKVVEAK